MILYLDTSSNYLYTGIVEGTKVLAYRFKELDSDLSSMTLPEIDSMFKEINASPKDINKIMVVVGPGSFTGVRIGVTIAKVYAWSLNKEIIEISSLEAMASSITGYDYVVPAIDARRGFVFAGIYDKDNNKVLEDRYIELSKLEEEIDKLPSKGVIVSNNDLETSKEVIKYTPNLEKIFELYGSRKSVNAHQVEPEYLKLTEAEENRLKSS